MQFPLPNEQPKWAILLIAGIGLAIALAARLWRRESSGSIQISWPGLLLTLLYLLLAIGIGIGPNWTEGAIRFAFWAFTLAIWLAAVRALRTEPAFINWLAWATSISGFIFSLHYWWNYFLEYGAPGYDISVLFSPIGQVNFTGDALAVLLPVLLWLLATRRELSIRMMTWVSATTCGTVLMVASSRGALVGLGLGVLIMTMIALRHGSRISPVRNRAAWLLLCSAFVASVTAYMVLPYHFRELARVSATFTGGKQTSVDHVRSTLAPVTRGHSIDQAIKVPQPPLASLWRRLSPWIGRERAAMYASTSAMIAESPWLGQGTGNFPYMYPKYSNSFPEFRDVIFSSATSYTTNPHNIFLQIASQNGLPAACIFLGLLVFFLCRLIAALWHRWEGLTAAGVVAVAAAIFDAMFNHLFFNPASMYVFALFAGIWYAGLPVSRPLFSVALRGKIWAACIVCLAILLCVWPMRWLASDWYASKALAAEPYLAGMATNYLQADRLDPYNFRAVYGMAKVGFLRKDYAAVIRELEWLRKIFPYNAAALNMLGVAYMLKGRLPEAEQALFESLAVLPDYKKARQNLRRLQLMATSSDVP